MATYEYACVKCGKRFDIEMPIREHGTRKVRCPKCKSLRVKQRVSGFFAQTAKKS